MPGVSITSSFGCTRNHCSDRVTPALSSVFAAVRRRRPLMTDDLPVFGMPTTIARVAPRSADSAPSAAATRFTEA